MAWRPVVGLMSFLLCGVACTSTPRRPAPIAPVVAPKPAGPTRPASSVKPAPSVEVPDPKPTGFASSWFEVGTSHTYSLRDVVDSHDVSGEGSLYTLTETYRVTSVTYESGGWSATGEWTVVGGSPPSDLPTSWRLEAGGFSEDPNHSGRVFRATDMAYKGLICHQTTDVGPYGNTKRVVCVDELGLFSLHEENLHGPRVFDVVRIK